MVVHVHNKGLYHSKVRTLHTQRARYKVQVQAVMQFRKGVKQLCEFVIISKLLEICPRALQYEFIFVILKGYLVP